MRELSTIAKHKKSEGMKNMTNGYSISPFDTSNSALDQQMAADVQTYTNACEEYENVNSHYQADMKEFNSITDPMAAMIFFITICAPDFLSASEANINVYSTQMNISNDMRTFGTDATNNENEATSITSPDATSFENDINDLQKWTEYLIGNDEKSDPTNFSILVDPFDPNATDPYNTKTGEYLSPIDATNASSILSDCTSIENAFGTTTDKDGNSVPVWSTSGNPDNGEIISSTIKSWFTIPTSSSSISSFQENPNVKATQEALQEINSSVSTLSSAQQTNFQYYLGNYNQCVSMCNSLGEEEIKGETTMISNQRAQ